MVGRGSLTSAHASMNHLAFNIAPERIDDVRRALAAAGVDCTPVVNHDDSETGASMTLTDSTFVRSVYFQDPDGILLEFAAWTRELDERDVNCEPMSADEVASAE
jgi:catechol 2,3-dioxygenase-like lactoylglutathione lyase family enzyme